MPVQRISRHNLHIHFALCGRAHLFILIFYIGRVLQAARPDQDLDQVTSEIGESGAAYIKNQVLELLPADFGVGDQQAHILVGTNQTQYPEHGRPFLYLARLLRQFEHCSGIRPGNS